MSLNLGLNLGYSGAAIGDVLPLVQRAESAGFDSVWVAEAYGSDAVSVLGWLAASTSRIKLGSAILQIPARTPAMTAMTAMTLDALSGGRLLLGLGVSGPQVVEGWHGQPYGKPLRRTREYVEIVRKAIARAEPLTYEGHDYTIPYAGEDATGLGKPLRSILHPVRDSIPIYLAAIGPRNVALAAEIADGWLPIFYAPAHEDVYAEALTQGGHKRRTGMWLLDVAAQVPVVVGDDVAACRDRLKPQLALYVGGMGAKGRNFYHDLATRYGYGGEADAIQDAYLGGRRDEAVALVPDELVDDVALVGPPGRIRERFERWRGCRATTLVLQAHQPEAIDLMAELAG
jgi:F420-dependent oxidoreductase-like protein